MKNIYINLFIIFISTWQNIAISQTRLTPEELQLIIQQVKKEVLDSLKATESTKEKSNFLENLKLSGYLETFYGYDFGNPDNHTRPVLFFCILTIGIMKLI